MKAVVYKGPRQLAVEDIPMPEVLPGYALIKVKASGICGSDIHGYLGTDVTDADSEALEMISRGILKNGVTAYLPTAMTAP